MARQMGVRKQKQMKKDLLLVLEKNMGVITPSLKTLNLSKHYFNKWMANDPEFRTAVENIKSIALDFVESKLFKLIESGNVVSVLFYLKCQGKERGYIDRQLIEGEVKLDPIKIIIKTDGKK